MGFVLRKCLLFSAFASLVFFCSCDKHAVGELPELQQEHVYPVKAEAEAAASPASTPEAKPTPADFFPETKPQ